MEPPPQARPSTSRTTKKERKTFDWISDPHAHNLTPFQQFIINDIDWEKSPLGPIASWSDQLRQMVLIVVADPTPAVVYWGDGNTIVYNEAYTQLIGLKHPALQGQDPRIEFAEIWTYFENLLATQRETGLTTVEGNQFLLLKRHGYLEETYFSWKFVPIIGNEGYVVGSHATVVEVTREVMSHRRLATVDALGREISETKTIKGLWSRVLRGLEGAPKDVPLALLYSITDVSETSESSSGTGNSSYSGTIMCNLEGSVGVPKGHPIAPDAIDIMLNKSWLALPFRKAMKGGVAVILKAEDKSLPSNVLEGIEWRGHGVPSTTMVVCPIHLANSDDALAFLVIALNPRRPYDEDYRNFIHMLTKHITTPQASAVLLREELKKRQMAAKLEANEREKLSLELSTLALEFEQSETKFSRFAGRAQVGLAIFDKSGLVVYANHLWRELTWLDVGLGIVSWKNAIVPQDLGFVHLMFDRVLLEGNPATFQFRVKKPWRTPNPDRRGDYLLTDTHVLCSVYPDLDENGQVMTIMSCLTDISELKFIEAQLRRRTADVELREQMWRNFTDRAPIGLCLINPDGSLEFGNDTWWSMTETPRNEKSGLSWLRKSVLPEDVTKVEDMFKDALNHNTAATLEFRLNRYWAGPEQYDEGGEVVRVRTTILGTVHTTFNDDGTVRHLVGWLTDISAQKAAEDVLRRRMDQAIELKKQQDRFIDMTSHEMRNPLSAMLHSADAIIASLNDYHTVVHGNGNSDDNALYKRPKLELGPVPQHLLKDAIESADTIIYCAMHQKRIVDDILTLSRLDSDLLLITPEAEQPIQLVRNATRMFEAELKRAEIQLDFQEEDNLQELNVQWTLLDPSRVLQVFINLMTNAIKFTRTESSRYITITIGASLTKPSGLSDGVKYVPKSQTSRDQTLSADWGDGEIIYLTVSVTDTGRGLSEQERKVLFNLFQQASPKTHVRYGGSGLGLFISRQLVEMQGGEIGVASEAGKGSTFRFFIKTRRTDPPVASTPDIDLHTLMDDDALIGACGVGVQTMRHEVKASPSLNTKPSKDLHILVVEDNLVNQKVASKQLRNNGCTVSVANHGEEALDFICRSESWEGLPKGVQGEKLSVILMDLEMPVMDGITCVKRIRELQASGAIRGHVPVIAVTANARKDQIKVALDAGMDDVTTKPYRIQEILKQIEKLVAKNNSATRTERVVDLGG